VRKSVLLFVALIACSSPSGSTVDGGPLLDDAGNPIIDGAPTGDGGVTPSSVQIIVEPNG